MALLLTAATCDDLVFEAVASLLQARSVSPAPTKGDCVEVSAITLELTNPRARISQSVMRGRPYSALGEFAWYLSGGGGTEQIAYYISAYRKFDENGQVHGAYGPRLRAYDGVDQLIEVIDLLRRNPSSRRAVIQLYDHTDLIGAHRDVPCTCVMQFLLRDGQLQLIVYMRSNDVYLGLPHDLFCFTMLQEVVARCLAVELGSYTHVVGSLHLYDTDRGDAQSFIDEGRQSTLLAMPMMPEANPLGSLAALLAVESKLRAGTPWQQVPLSEEPYWSDLERMYAAFQLRRGPRAELELLRSKMSSNFYDPFIVQLLDRISED